jgi:tRNA nucleotidyltransferase/poly(A) polymerase
MAKIYKVGGCVRDKFLGIDSKDIDFTFVCEDSQTVEGGWIEMTSWMRSNDFEIFLETPSCFTVRAKFPKDHKYAGMVADFVMARKEIGYIPGTRQPILELGTLEDDLIRRDFTLNALAEDKDGKIIDLFNGIEALKAGQLITPLDCKKTFDDDPLRILRAIRFCITKGFHMDSYMEGVIRDYDYANKMEVVSMERIREELFKCFKHDTIITLTYLNQYPSLRNYIFGGKELWLKPTMEQ